MASGRRSSNPRLMEGLGTETRSPRIPPTLLGHKGTLIPPPFLTGRSGSNSEGTSDLLHLMMAGSVCLTPRSRIQGMMKAEHTIAKK